MPTGDHDEDVGPCSTGGAPHTVGTLLVAEPHAQLQAHLLALLAPSAPSCNAWPASVCVRPSWHDDFMIRFLVCPKRRSIGQRELFATTVAAFSWQLTLVRIFGCSIASARALMTTTGRFTLSLPS